MLRELQALCRVHGLPTGGSSADLAARLAALLPGRVDAAAAEVAAARRVGKGCLKRPGSGEGSGPAKKVKFILEEEAAAVADAGVEAMRRSRRLAGNPPGECLLFL